MSGDKNFIDKKADEFIASMKWSKNASDWEKLLVVGNVRGFTSFLKKALTQNGCDKCDKLNKEEADDNQGS
jgi:hypothetical protein